MNGCVLRVIQESAAVVPAGARLLELGDPEALEVEIDVLSADGVKIKPGAMVVLEHWGGEEALLGRVRLVEPAAFLKVSALGEVALAEGLPLGLVARDGAEVTGPVEPH